jgi:predicted metal-dependent HD superfamily phosphohydrolase
MNLSDNVIANQVLDCDRFRQLWHDCLLDSAADESSVIHQNLIDSYSEPQRHYHTLSHIVHCLSLFDKISAELHNPEALELAIWFHDVIYTPGATDNEQLSADQFMALTSGIFSDQLRDTVYQHIMATVHDGSEFKNADTNYMLDIDLSSFGRPWPEFIQDSDNLRLEMGNLSDAVFYKRQAAFQDRLFSRPRFFRSEYFYNHFESQARQNRRDYFKDIQHKTHADR